MLPPMLNREFGRTLAKLIHYSKQKVGKEDASRNV